MNEEFKNISHPDMVGRLAKKGNAIRDTLTDVAMHNLHMAVGIAGEIAELFDAIVNNLANRDLALEEHGDLLFYMEGLRQGAQLEYIEPNAEQETLRFADALNRLVVLGGDILDIVKKETIYGQTLDTAKLNSTLHAIDFVLNVIRHGQGFSREECLQANIQKLGKRYLDFTYTDAAAKERADKAMDNPHHGHGVEEAPKFVVTNKE